MHELPRPAILYRFRNPVIVLPEALGQIRGVPDVVMPCGRTPQYVYEVHGDMVRPERFELPAFWFVARRSIQLSYGRMVKLFLLPCLTISLAVRGLLVSASGGLYPAELWERGQEKNSTMPGKLPPEGRC
jgi:hypothetical protein